MERILEYYSPCKVLFRYKAQGVREADYWPEDTILAQTTKPNSKPDTNPSYRVSSVMSL